MGLGKLRNVGKMLDVRRPGESFVADDPHRNQNDSAMTRIHCPVQR
jgi:hypothetical protein